MQLRLGSSDPQSPYLVVNPGVRLLTNPRAREWARGNGTLTRTRFR
jgi:hypothetical protein